MTVSLLELLYQNKIAEYFYNKKKLANIYIYSGFAVCASGNDHHFEEDFVQTFFAKEKHWFFNPKLGTNNGKSDTPTINSQHPTPTSRNKNHRQRHPTINSLQPTTDTRQSTLNNYHRQINPITEPTPEIWPWTTDRRARLEARTSSCYICHKLEVDNDRSTTTLNLFHR